MSTAANMSKPRTASLPGPPDSFYARYGKRAFDLALAVTGLVLSSPLLALISIAIKCSSRGRVLFSQQRIGLHGRQFKILKFRTMVADAERKGPAITWAGDPRITRVGALLRRWKLDELPQFWNVLKGDMSFVGPRPELPSYVQNYTPWQRQVLSVRPGITCSASLRYRNEEELLALAPNRDQVYEQVVLPYKIALSLGDIQSLSFHYDVKLILRTLGIAAGISKLASKESRNKPA